MNDYGDQWQAWYERLGEKLITKVEQPRDYNWVRIPKRDLRRQKCARAFRAVTACRGREVMPK